MRPSYLEKRTLTPQQEDLVVDGPQLTISRPQLHEQRTLDLRDQPDIGVLVDAVRGTLAGDLDLLRRHFGVGLEGSPQSWRLTLVPTDAAVARFLHVVRIDGAGNAVHMIDTVGPNGDTTRMTIEPAS